jgi:hypothetical protein
VEWRGVRLGWRWAGWPRDVVHASTWAFGAAGLGDRRRSATVRVEFVVVVRYG